MAFRLAWVCILAGAACAQDTARMEEVVTSYLSGNKFMGSVLVARGSDVLLSKGYGFADLEWKVPDAPSTKYRLGSITKQFTAAAILLLQERGKLQVSDPVKKYMPDAPAAWDKITIFHLLTHTSGIPNFTNFSDYAALEPFPATPAKLVARFRDRPLEFTPGEKWAYSNSGYVLLGFLLEKITGGKYADFVQDNIFAPLGMKDSGYDSNFAIIPLRADGYTSGADGFRHAGYIDMTIPFSAGALYSTTEDLLRWETGLFGGKLLSAASLAAMTTPFKHDYALGLAVNTRWGHKVISHGGGIEGFNTFLAYDTDDKITVAVLANVNGSAPEEIASNLGALLHGDKVELPSERKEISVSPKVLSQYVGTYELAPNVMVKITLAEDQLRIQLTGQPRFPLFAESESRFFLKVVDAQIDFVKNGEGAVTGLVLHQNGRDMKAPRKSATVKEAPERKSITVPLETLKRYTGTYQLRPGFDLVITLEGDQLMAQATGQPKFPIFPESPTRFFLKVVDAQIDFIQDGKSSVTGLVLHQGGQDIQAPRQ